MIRTNFYGELLTKDSDLAREILEEWLDADLKVRVKILGDHIVYEDSQTYVFAESGVHPGRETFLLQGHFDVGLDESREKLQRLHDLAKLRSIEMDADYMQVNEAGDEVSEEYHIG